VLVLLIALVARQRSVIYLPTPPGATRSPRDNPAMMVSPRDWRLPFEEVKIRTEDGVNIAAWLVYQPPSSVEGEVPYTFIYFHGNAGNIGHRLQNVSEMWTQLKINVLIVDYRGYGDSEDGPGPSERGFIMDAKAAYSWLVARAAAGSEAQQPRISADRILLFGRSIGGAVAIRLMRELLEERLRDGSKALAPPAGLVLENTFTSLGDMAVQVFWFLWPLRPILRSPLLLDEWKSADSLQYITENLQHWCCCLLSGKQDQMVPPAQMKQLHALLKQRQPKVLRFFSIAKGGHNDTALQGGPDYWKSLASFMSNVDSTEEERKAAIAALGRTN